MCNPFSTILLFAIFFACCYAASEVGFFTTVTGLRIPISLIRKKLGVQLPLTAFPHIIYEQTSPGILKGYHEDINITALLDRGKTKVSPISHFFRQDNQSIPQSTVPYQIGNKYVFSYGTPRSRLISALGPSLNLSNLQIDSYPDVFVNVASNISDLLNMPLYNNSLLFRDSNDFVKNSDHPSTPVYLFRKHTDITVRKSQRSQAEDECTHLARLHLNLYSDASLCDFETGKKSDMEESVKTVSRILEENFCVRLIPRVIKDCEQIIQENAVKEKCSEPWNDCKQTCLIMKSFSSIRREDADGKPLIIFSDLNWVHDKLAGAAFLSDVCAAGRSLVWVNSNPINQFVLAHEIGHLLGAGHDGEGVMRSTVLNNDTLWFSKNSTVSIKRFLQRDIRSWCLHRDFSWVRPNLNYPSNVSLAFDESSRRVFKTYSILVNGQVEIAYVWATIPNSCSRSSTIEMIDGCLPNKDDGKCTNYKRLPVQFLPTITMFKVVFGKRGNIGETSLVLSYLRNGDFFFRILIVKKDSEQIISATIGAENYFHQLPKHEGVVDTSLATAYFYSRTQVNIIQVIVLRQNGRNNCYYRVGLDLQFYGSVKEWTKAELIRGWFNDVEDLEISVADLNDNGLPELIISFKDNGIMPNDPNEKYKFVLIGRDMDETGRLTSGWTKTSNNESMYFKGFTKLYKVPWCLSPIRIDVFPTMISLPDSAGSIQFEVGMQKLMNTDAPEGNYLDDLSDGCRKCYRKKGESVSESQCKREIEACASRVDQVLLPDDGSLSRAPKYASHCDTKESNVSTSLPPGSSLFCIGFDYYLRSQQSCDIIDRERLEAKGLQIEFERLLLKTGGIPRGDLNSTSIFESPSQSGTNGLDNRPVVAVFEIVESKKLRVESVQHAIKILRSRPGFNSFDVKSSITQKRIERNGKTVVVITFIANLPKET